MSGAGAALVAPSDERGDHAPRVAFASRRKAPSLPCLRILRRQGGATTMDTIKPLFTATATATGGRNGPTQSSDGIVSANLSVPKEMGGPGKPGSATPQHPFPAGYPAGFGGGAGLLGQKNKKEASPGATT